MLPYWNQQRVCYVLVIYCHTALEIPGVKLSRQQLQVFDIQVHQSKSLSPLKMGSSLILCPWCKTSTCMAEEHADIWSTLYQCGWKWNNALSLWDVQVILLQLTKMTIISTPPMGMSLMIATPLTVLVWTVSIQWTLYMDCVLNLLSAKLTLFQQTILNRQLKHAHEQTWSEGTYQWGFDNQHEMGERSYIETIALPAKHWCKLYQIDWVEFMSTEYIRVIDDTNYCNKKMIEIGKCAEVFRPIGGRRPDILTAKSKVEFQKTKKT